MAIQLLFYVLQMFVEAMPHTPVKPLSDHLNEEGQVMEAGTVPEP